MCELMLMIFRQWKSIPIVNEKIRIVLRQILLLFPFLLDERTIGY